MTDLARIFGVKLAFTPLPTALFGAGLGAGIAHLVDRHMGPYRSSLDGAQGAE